MGQQRGDQLLLANAAGLGLAHQAHGGVFARLVAHHIEHRQHAGLELGLVLRQGFFTGLDLGVGQLLDLFEHPLGADARRQLGDDQLPLAARQVFDLPARPAFQRAAATAVGLGNVGSRADDLGAARKVGPGNQGEQLVVAELGRLDQRHAGVCHLSQVVAGDFCGQAHSNPAGTIEQGKGQPGRQLARLNRGAIVIRHEIDRAFVNLIEQQTGDFGQPGLGVAHGRSAIAIAAAEIALAIDQRVALAEILRHAHQRIVGSLVAMRVKPAQNVAHHTRALDRLGPGVAIGAAKTQPHARHGVEDAPLHRLLAVADIGQGPTLDHAQGVLQVGTLRVAAQAGRLGALGRWRGREIQAGLLAHD